MGFKLTKQQQRQGTLMNLITQVSLHTERSHICQRHKKKIKKGTKDGAKRGINQELSEKCIEM